MSNMIEIRWHGRGGQGAKTASLFLATAALHEGKKSQGFPDYGPERGGAPIRAYNRISEEEIRLHCSIDEPDIVVVLDKTLLNSVNVCEGLKEGGTLIINDCIPPAEIRKRYDIKAENIKIYTVDATQISIDEIGKPMPNTSMLGALVKATGILNIENVYEDIKEKFAKKFSQKIIDGNLKAIERAYEEVVEE
jgi:pyruvate ferredoxin oxidoreductase gamma subunit